MPYANVYRSPETGKTIQSGWFPSRKKAINMGAKHPWPVAYRIRLTRYVDPTESQL